MFVEVTKSEYEKLNNYLYDNNIPREISDCTIPGEKIQHVHVEFGELNSEQIDGINRMLEVIKQQLLKETGSVEEKNMDADGDGRADYLEELDAEEAKKNEASKALKRKKRDTTMNPVTAAKDYFFGNDEKEIE